MLKICYCFLFCFFCCINLIAQQIGYNYAVKNNEIVFKVILKPRQNITLEYLNKYYGQEKLMFTNSDSIENTVIGKTEIYAATIFHLGLIHIDENIIKYDFNFTGALGDSILIDCRYTPYRIYAKRLLQGQLYTDIDSMVIPKYNETNKPAFYTTSDSNYYLNLEKQVYNRIKTADDSVKIYTRYFSEFRKSVGYRQTLQMQQYSKAFRELFKKMNRDQKPDSCYESTIRKFEPQLQYLLKYPKIIVASKENYSALYGYILYQIYKSQRTYSIENAFDIIDSLAKGDYNIICKLIFLNIEKDNSTKKKFLEKMVSSDNADSASKAYLKNLRNQIVFFIPLSKERIFIDNLKDSSSLNEAIKKSGKKLYLLNFWASWCKPCISEFKDLKSLTTKITNKNFVIIYLSIDENHIDWKKAEKEYNLPANHSYIINDSIKSKFLEELEIKSIPRSILIDEKGKILDFNAASVNVEVLESTIINLLKNI